MKINHLLMLSALWLGQAGAMTMPEQAVKSYACESCNQLSHEPLSTAWAISNQTLSPKIMHKQASKKYRIRTTLGALQRGIPLSTTAPGAIIRIVTEGNNIRPQFRLQKGNTINLPLQEAASSLASKNSLLDTVFANDTLALLQLKSALGDGVFTLSTTQVSGQPDDKAVVNVFDKKSSLSLSIATDKAQYHYGELLNATITLTDGSTNLPIDKIAIALNGPEGQIIALTPDISGGVAKASILLNDTKGSLGKNWYIDASVTTTVANVKQIREVHSAFSYFIPSAVIREINTGETPLHFSARLEVATASRYALQAVLFHQDADGKMQALAMAQSAVWADVGESELRFNFAVPGSEQFKGPFFIGAIELMDYGQLKPVVISNAIINP